MKLKTIWQGLSPDTKGLIICVGCLLLAIVIGIVKVVMGWH